MFLGYTKPLGRLLFKSAIYNHHECAMVPSLCLDFLDIRNTIPYVGTRFTIDKTTLTKIQHLIWFIIKSFFMMYKSKQDYFFTIQVIQFSGKHGQANYRQQSLRNSGSKGSFLIEQKWSIKMGNFIIPFSDLMIFWTNF